MNTESEESMVGRWPSVNEFCKEKDLGRNTVYEAIRRNEIPHVKVGRRILIAPNALEIMLAAQAVSGE